VKALSYLQLPTNVITVSLPYMLQLVTKKKYMLQLLEVSILIGDSSGFPSIK